VRFEKTPQFDRDWAALKSEHRRQFLDVVPTFSKACDDYAAACAARTGSAKKVPAYRWPARLRVKPMKSAPGIWEMTWSFASPDGRATFEFVTDERGMLVRWRRIGDHGIYRQP
jgi:hypothetical protein